MGNLRDSRGGSRRGCLPESGWRRAALVNSIILGAMTVGMFCCLAASTSQTRGVTKVNFFFNGTCGNGGGGGGSAARLNVGLHLLINVVSTAVFASSNFFMQVVNSPSREEIETAHANGLYLSIGVTSARNLFRVSRFKTCSWLILLVSSIPIHLLFNSMIFQTDNRMADFQVTIASTDFLNDASYYAPGASLLPSGFDVYLNQSAAELAPGGYWGLPVSIQDYQNPNSELRRNISSTAANGTGWNKINAVDCYNIYSACHGLKLYRNVIIVPNTTFSWVRDELWNLTSIESNFWDPMVPATETNSLWFHAQCSVSIAPP